MKLTLLLALAVAGASEHGATVQAGAAQDTIPSCCQNNAPTFDPMHFVANANPPAPGAVVGAVSGKVVFEGDKPEMEPLEIVPQKAEGCVESGSVDSTDRSLLLGAGDGISNVVVVVEVDGAEVEVPEAPIVLDQKACRFEPHVVAIPAGATVTFLNSDAVSHNVHLYPGKNDPFNGTIGAGSKTDRTLDKEDKIRVKCDIHPWMESWILVTETPYMAVTGADGSFEIPDLPPGEYKVEFWHEKLGKGDTKITVGADGSADPIEMKMGEEKKKSRGRRR